MKFISSIFQGYYQNLIRRCEDTDIERQSCSDDDDDDSQDAIVSQVSVVVNTVACMYT